MNNSEPALTETEEKLTAFLDGKLSPAAAAAFASEHPEVAALRSQHAKLRTLLAVEAPTLKHGEFFNHQILRDIQPPAPAREKVPFFPLWRLAFAAGVCAIAAAGVYLGVVGNQATSSGDYFAQVTSVKAGDSDITAQLIEADGMAVVWIDGLDSLPNDYVLE